MSWKFTYECLNEQWGKLFYLLFDVCAGDWPSERRKITIVISLTRNSSHREKSFVRKIIRAIENKKS